MKSAYVYHSGLLAALAISRCQGAPVDPAQLVKLEQEALHHPDRSHWPRSDRVTPTPWPDGPPPNTGWNDPKWEGGKTARELNDRRLLEQSKYIQPSFPTPNTQKVESVLADHYAHTTKSMAEAEPYLHALGTSLVPHDLSVVAHQPQVDRVSVPEHLAKLPRVNSSPSWSTDAMGPKRTSWPADGGVLKTEGESEHYHQMLGRDRNPLAIKKTDVSKELPPHKSPPLTIDAPWGQSSYAELSEAEKLPKHMDRLSKQNDQYHRPSRANISFEHRIAREFAAKGKEPSDRYKPPPSLGPLHHTREVPEGKDARVDMLLSIKELPAGSRSKAIPGNTTAHASGADRLTRLEHKQQLKSFEEAEKVKRNTMERLGIKLDGHAGQQRSLRDELPANSVRKGSWPVPKTVGLSNPNFHNDLNAWIEERRAEQALNKAEAVRVSGRTAKHTSNASRLRGSASSSSLTGGRGGSTGSGKSGRSDGSRGTTDRSSSTSIAGPSRHISGPSIHQPEGEAKQVGQSGSSVARSSAAQSGKISASQDKSTVSSKKKGKKKGKRKV